VLTPFCESLPDILPVLQIYPNEKQLLERYIGTRIKEKTYNDSVDSFSRTFDFCTFQPLISYDLDEYTRFSSISETILEFINKVRVSRVEGKRKISVFLNERQGYSPRTLVLLDGIPIYDHEDILRYNPMHIKRIDIYYERYMFGDEDFDGIVLFTTHEGHLPFFQLNNESQLLHYDCPQHLPVFDMPDYSTDSIRNSGKPDFRHTLYWNPFVEFTNGRPVNHSFYTSDLCGEFKVIVEGITSDGKILQGVSCFRVPE
jgi:hypothetical protein